MKLLNSLLSEDSVALPNPKKEIWLAIRTDVPADWPVADMFGSGSSDNPFDASTAERFDAILKAAESNSLVRVGPGIFRTRGKGFIESLESFWVAKPGQKIIGSGMWSTTLLYTCHVPLGSTNSIAEIIAGVSTAPLLDFEVSDLTIDCDLANQPIIEGQKFPRLSIRAISIVGSDVQVRRVRVINFGTRTPFYVNGASDLTSAEGFPIRVAGCATVRNLTNFTSQQFPSFNACVEDCIIEQPDTSPAREITCLVVTGGINVSADPSYTLPDGRSERLHLQPSACVVRNCYINLEYINPRQGRPILIDSISYSGTAPDVIATIRTRFPHNVNKKSGDFVSFIGAADSRLARRFPVEIPESDTATSRELTCKIGFMPTGAAPSMVFKCPPQTIRAAQLARVGSVVTVTTAEKHLRLEGELVTITGAQNSGYNGTFKLRIGGTLTDYTFEVELEAGNTPPTPDSGELWLDRRPNAKLQIQSLTEAASESGVFYSTITTKSPHFRKAGEWVSVFGVLAGLGGGVVENLYNNYLQIHEVVDRFKLKVKLPGDTPNKESPHPGSLDTGIFTNFQAISANGGIGGGMFGNIVANCNRAGTYHDTWFEDEFIGRRNYLHNVYAGPLTVFSPDSRYGEGDYCDYRYRNAKVTAISGTLVTAALDTEKADPACRRGLSMRFILQSDLGKYVDAELLSVGFNAANKYEFTFVQPTPLVFAVNDSIWANLWFQQNRYLYEDNVLELAFEPAGGSNLPAAGVTFQGPYWESPLRGLNNGAKQPWLLQSAIVRDNYIRKVGGVTDPGNNLSIAAVINSCRSFIVEGNVFPLMNPGFTYSDKAMTFKYSDCRNTKTFNNQRPDGLLWQFYNDPYWLNNTDYWLDEIQTIAENAVWAGIRSHFPF